MFRIFALIVGFATFLTFAHADGQNAADQSAIQTTIAGQLEAFQKQDAVKAYSYAAPNVTTIFPSVDKFMAMVQRGYQPILNNTEHKFGALSVDTIGRLIQRMTITAVNGKNYEAIYAVEKQPDGSWKISGVQLQEIPGVGV